MVTKNELDGDRPVDELDLVSVGRFLLRNAHLWIGSTVAAAVVTVLVLLFFVPPRYQASAVVGINVVEDPPVPFRLNLPRDLYQEILESSVLQQAVRRQLAATGLDLQEQDIQLVSRVRRPSPSGDEPEGSTPVRLTGTARSASAAAAAANTWSHVFVTEAKRTLGESAAEELERLDQYAGEARARIVGLQERIVQRADATTDREYRLRRRWLTRVQEHERKSAALRTDFELETMELVHEPSGRLDSAEAELAAVRSAYAQALAGEGETRVGLERARARFVALQEDETGPDREPDLPEARAEVEAARRAVEASEEHTASLVARRSELEASVARLRREVESLKFERRAQLERLMSKREAKAEQLAVDRTTELQRLADGRRPEAARLVHELTVARDRLHEVEKLLGASRASLVRTPVAWVIEEADTPLRPVSSRLTLKTAVAAMVGLLFGLVVATLRESFT